MLPSSKTVLDMFFQAANTCPQQVAIELNEQLWTYAELLASVIQIACCLQIEANQIIYQCIHRSLEMVCGVLGIMCAGGVYCPLNPTDPAGRIRSLLDETKGRIVLVHENTRNKFTNVNNQQVQIIDVDRILLVDITEYGDEKEIYLNSESPSFIICTSGTTGQQKSIVHTHGSLVAGFQALINWDLKKGDKILQVAAVSWLIHVLEIFLPFVSVPSGTLVLMRPGDNLNMTRFCTNIIDKQITILLIGTSLLKVLVDYIKLDSNRFKYTLRLLRIIWLTGESFKPKDLINLKILAPQTRMFMSYGQSEVIAPIGCYLEHTDDELKSLDVLPIGYPQLGYQCILIGENNEQIISPSCSNELGQIYLKGIGLFHCYYNNIELTKRTRVVIKGEQFLETGDLARYNSRGELVYVGRVDFQIKIRGQRVEVAEVEGTIMASLPNEISNCLVVKFPEDEDSLVAYIISNNSTLDIKSIRDYCNEHLRQYMIPYYFVILEKFPLNANGKIDRKQLPLPYRNIPTQFIKASEERRSELENKIHSMWCSMLQLDFVPRDANCFVLGGSSITMMRIVNYYQVYLIPDKELDELNFFSNPTIADHVRYLTNT